MLGFWLILFVLLGLTPLSASPSADDPQHHCRRALELIDEARAIELLLGLEYSSEVFQRRLRDRTVSDASLFHPSGRALARHLLTHNKTSASHDFSIKQPFQLWMLKKVEAGKMTIKIPVVHALDPTTEKSLEPGERNTSGVAVLSAVMDGVLLFVAQIFDSQTNLKTVEIELTEVINPVLQRWLRTAGLEFDPVSSAQNSRKEAKNYRLTLRRP